MKKIQLMDREGIWQRIEQLKTFTPDELRIMAGLIAVDIRGDWYNGGVATRIEDIKNIYEALGEECPQLDEGRIAENGRWMRNIWEGYYDGDITKLSAEARDFLEERIN